MNETNPSPNDLKQRVKNAFRQLQITYPELEDWTLFFDSARRRAGACVPSKQRIQVSRYHLQHNSWPVVEDTLLHEAAHALAWYYHEYTGHGAIWKQYARQLGASPQARGHFEVPEYPWVVVWYQQERQELVKLAGRYRKNRNIKQFAIKGRPDTKGQIFYLATEDYLRWERGEVELDKLSLVH
ncbi:SprT-like domain-containing protein [Pleionea sp. CnH1-48]|uniref:SprT-like domain-containing protein n=1 Tax=Pleionea sp. CnH1-48 TaxID=2954494 RepID=UPI0020980793|nr:SprT-like domain-containing protein [Pleionea sp. CnH1-48]MCO7222845.1 SprT-like domain-containing protein [Pleionea sp. CnH1-48]